NLVTNLPATLIPANCQPRVVLRGQGIPWGRCYSDVPVGAPIALIGSHGYVEIACHQGHAAQRFGVKMGDAVTLELTDTIS
ncbi:MAG: SAM-dependent chlorinase/fluorinase, partial [Gloeomargarita sp. GMQP_bins_25]